MSFDDALSRREDLWAETHADHDRIHREFEAERHMQDTRWGRQDHDDDTGEWRSLLREPKFPTYGELRMRAHELSAWLTDHKREVNWPEILLEEVFEALCEDDQRYLRRELVQVGAVVEAWIAKIDRDMAVRRAERDRRREGTGEG